MNITILDDYFDTLRACPVSASWTATRSPYGTTTCRTRTRWPSGCATPTRWC